MNIREKMHEIKRIVRLYKSEDTYIKMSNAQLIRDRSNVNLSSKLMHLNELSLIVDVNKVTDNDFVKTDLIREVSKEYSALCQRNKKKYENDPNFFESLFETEKRIKEIRREAKKEKLTSLKKASREANDRVSEILNYSGILTNGMKSSFEIKMKKELKVMEEYLSTSPARRVVLELFESDSGDCNPSDYSNLMRVSSKLSVLPGVNKQAIVEDYEKSISSVLSCELDYVQNIAVKQFMCVELDRISRDPYLYLVKPHLESENKDGVVSSFHKLKKLFSGIESMDEMSVKIYRTKAGNVIIADEESALMVSDKMREVAVLDIEVFKDRLFLNSDKIVELKEYVISDSELLENRNNNKQRCERKQAFIEAKKEELSESLKKEDSGATVAVFKVKNGKRSSSIGKKLR